MTLLEIEQALSTFAVSLPNQPKFVGIMDYRKPMPKGLSKFDFSWPKDSDDKRLARKCRSAAKNLDLIMSYTSSGNYQLSVIVGYEGAIYMVNVVSQWIIVVVFDFKQPLKPMEKMLESIMYHQQPLFDTIYSLRHDD